MKKIRDQNADRKRLDIRDVARHAGVSIATVSRTINAVPTVDRELVARVQRSIRELNDFPNTQARPLVWRAQSAAWPAHPRPGPDISRGPQKI